MTTSGANMNRPRIAHAFSEALGLSDPHRTPPPPPDRRNSFIHQDSGIESLTRTSSLGIHDESQGYVEQHNSFRNSRPAQHKYGMSSLTSKAEGFRTWSGRASHRSRLSLRTLLGHHPKELAPAREEDTSVFTHQETPESRPSTAKGWLKRAASTSLRRNKRPSSSTPHGSGVIESKRPCVHYPGTEFGIEHSFTSLNLSGGAAARAAAAAHNEGSVRTQIPRERLMLENLRVTNDAESGIGIDMRDDSEESYLGSGSVTRKDPASVLPKELFDHIITFLDARSLMKAEQVSKCWNSAASYHLVWQNIFQDEFCPRLSSEKSILRTQLQRPGLGGNKTDQDWKRLWQVRQLLNKRWTDGHAAAIYLEGHKDTVYCVQFDEDKIVTGSRDRSIRIWDAHTYKCIKVLGIPRTPNPNHMPAPITYRSNRGQRPFTSIFPPHFLGEPKPDVAPPDLSHDGSILCLQYDKTTLVTGSSDTTLILWDIVGDEYIPRYRLRHHTAGVLDVCFDSRYIVSCSKDTSVCLWDRKTGDLLRVLTGHHGPVNAVQLRGDLIVSASGDGMAKLWNLASSHCVKEFPSENRGLACVEFSEDGSTILAGGNDHVIYQFDANTGEKVREFTGHTNLVRSLHLDGTNERVVSGSYDYSVKVYGARDGELICDFNGWTTSWMLSAKADYRRIVATSQDRRVVIMDFGFGLPGVELLEC